MRIKHANSKRPRLSFFNESMLEKAAQYERIIRWCGKLSEQAKAFRLA